MEGLHYALAAVVSVPCLLAAAGGMIWGIIGGALPGINPSIAMALLLPFTFQMDALPAIVMLCSVYIGGEYGGSIPAILIRTPGTSAAAATVVDGYELHQQGKGGEALGLSLVGGVIGGLVGMIVLVAMTKPLSMIVLMFTPPAYFSLGICGLSIIASVSEGSLLKGLIAGLVGMMISTIGTDPLSGVSRFTFGQIDLLDGIDFIFVTLGIFALSEMMLKLATGEDTEIKTNGTVRRLKLPSLKTLWRLRRATAIGTGAGVLEGVIPGAGGTVAAFIAYNEAKRWSATPELFGKGSEEGVIAPETANNACTSTALVPTLSFGIPASNSMAVLLGGLLIHGITPGPLLLTGRSDLVYGLFGALFVANFMQLFFGVILLTPCMWLVNRPKPYLIACLFLLVLSGAYAVNYNPFDLLVVLAAGTLGYVMRALKFPVLPLILGVVLGYLLESNYRRALMITNGSHVIFFESTVSLILLVCAALIISSAIYNEVKRYRRLTADSGEPQAAAKPLIG
jgi:putative tricarboxylic transport membrane protein